MKRGSRGNPIYVNGGAKRRRVGTKAVKVVPGYTRQSGFYGMFNQPGVSKGELKFHDLDVNDAVIAAGGTVQTAQLTIAQGTTESQRIGRKVVIKSINWRYRLFLPATTSSASTSDIVRMIVFIDKQANGAAAGVTDLLESADFQSFNQLANKSRFTVLHDKTFNLESRSGAGDGTTNTYGEMAISSSFFKKCSIPIEYDNSGTTGAVTEIRSNNILVMLLSEQGLCTFDSKMRYRFLD